VGVYKEKNYTAHCFYAPAEYNDKYPVILLGPLALTLPPLHSATIYHSSMLYYLLSTTGVRCVCARLLYTCIQPVTVRRIDPTGMILIRNAHTLYAHTYALCHRIFMYYTYKYTVVRVYMSVEITRWCLCVRRQKVFRRSFLPGTLITMDDVQITP